MAAYDRLPKMLRTALAYAPGVYSAKELEEALQFGNSPHAVQELLYQAAERDFGCRQDDLTRARGREDG